MPAANTHGRALTRGLPVPDLSGVSTNTCICNNCMHKFLFGAPYQYVFALMLRLLTNDFALAILHMFNQADNEQAL